MGHRGGDGAPFGAVEFLAGLLADDAFRNRLDGRLVLAGGGGVDAVRDARSVLNAAAALLAESEWGVEKPETYVEARLRVLEAGLAGAEPPPPHFERAPAEGVAESAATHVDAPLVPPAILSVMNVMRTVDQD